MKRFVLCIVSIVILVLCSCSGSENPNEFVKISSDEFNAIYSEAFFNIIDSDIVCTNFESTSKLLGITSYRKNLSKSHMINDEEFYIYLEYETNTPSIFSFGSIADQRNYYEITEDSLKNLATEEYLDKPSDYLICIFIIGDFYNYNLVNKAGLRDSYVDILPEFKSSAEHYRLNEENGCALRQIYEGTASGDIVKSELEIKIQNKKIIQIDFDYKLYKNEVVSSELSFKVEYDYLAFEH